MKDIIIMLGPQGSGKSTQAKLLAKKYNYIDIIESNILRKEAKKKTKLGKEIKTKMSKGILVPFEVTCDLLFKKINLTKKNKIIIDGFPREIEQAHVLDYFIYSNKHKLVDVIYVDVPKNICVKRMLLRKRDDDKPNIIKKRLEIYFKETKPLINYYKKRLIKINGARNTNEVFKEINKKIKSRV